MQVVLVCAAYHTPCNKSDINFNYYKSNYFESHAIRLFGPSVRFDLNPAKPVVLAVFGSFFYNSNTWGRVVIISPAALKTNITPDA